MVAPLRRAGRGRAPDGAEVTWSVAEGGRGRRWREIVATGEGIRSSLLLELDPDGRFSHLELSTRAGLLTLHPEPDGTLHGNTVTAGGVGPVAGLAWDHDALVLLEGSAVCAAVGASRGGQRGPMAALRIGLDLSLERSVVPPNPNAAGPDGLPALAAAESWPLEGPG